jgi:drug/metabolite transporter (DMT)-like permease
VRAAPVGLGAILVGATAASLGTVLLKRGPRQDPFGANAVGCAIGAPIAGTLSFALGETHALPATLGAAWPLVYLTVGGSVGAYVIMSWLVHHWSVTRTSYVTVIVPVIALALGGLVRHERLAPASLAGAALILAGLLLGMRPELDA